MLTREEKRRARRIAWLIVLGMMAIAGLCLGIPMLARELAPVVIPDESEALLNAAEGMDEISIVAEFDPEQGTLTAEQTITVTNRTGDTLSGLTLRSYSGAYLTEETSPAATDEWYYASYPEGFDAGGLTLSGARVDGSIVLYSWLDEASTVLYLPLSTALQPEETVTVELAYSVKIPKCSSRFGVNDGVWTLNSVFPTLALYEDGQWRTDTVHSIGYPYLSECANWTVTLTLPEGYTVASSVYAKPALEQGKQTLTMAGHALRDFALVISDQFTAVTAMEDDVLLAAYARTTDQAQEMLKYLRQALRSYEKHYGEYAYPTLSAAAVSIPNTSLAASRLVMITDYFAQYGGQTLEFAVANATARQWWQVMVGSDGWYEPWQHESLGQYALMDYIGDYYGQQSRESAIFDQIETAMRITIPRGVTPGSPIDYFSGSSEYTQVVSLRGASLWIAMETMLGKDALDGALRDYAAQYRFEMATREDLTVILENAAGRELDDLLTDYLDTNIVN